MSEMPPNLTLRVVLVGLLAACSVGQAATLRVPQDYPSITEASNAAVLGDSILVWPPPVGDHWEYQTITLQQGVMLRGMTDLVLNDPYMVVSDSFFYLLEAPPNGGDDTTRVENFPITTSEEFHENVQVYTPRSSITGCRMGNPGPENWPCVRVWKGGLIARNAFYALEAVTAREGTIRIEGNFIQASHRAIGIFNFVGNPGPANASIRSNTVYTAGAEVDLHLGAASQAEVVNNIFNNVRLLCTASGAFDIRYNDLRGAQIGCPLGVGNIFVDPLFCSIMNYSILELGVEPGSPCAVAGENGATMGAGGICGITGIGDGQSPPLELGLTVNPNPVQFGAEFGFSGGVVSPILDIYNAGGKLIERLHPVAQQVQWRPDESIPRGVYFARLLGKGHAEVVKFVLIR